MVSVRVMFMTSESTSRLPMKSLLYRYTISSAKAKESFTVNTLNIIDKNVGTKNFASL